MKQIPLLEKFGSQRVGTSIDVSHMIRYCSKPNVNKCKHHKKGHEERRHPKMEK